MISEQTLAHIVNNARGSRAILEANDTGLADKMLLSMCDAEIESFFSQIEMPLDPEEIGAFIVDAMLHFVKIGNKLGLTHLLSPEVACVMQVIILGGIVERIHA